MTSIAQQFDLCIFRDGLQVQLLILSEFKRINLTFLPPEIIRKHMVFCDFRVNRDQSILLNSLNIRNKIWKRSLIIILWKVVKNVIYQLFELGCQLFSSYNGGQNIRNKVNKSSNISNKKFYICCSILLEGYNQNFISGIETGHQAMSPSSFEIFQKFYVFLDPKS